MSIELMLAIGVAACCVLGITNTVLIVRIMLRLPLDLREEMHEIRNALHEHNIRIEALETAPFKKARD